MVSLGCPGPDAESMMTSRQPAVKALESRRKEKTRCGLLSSNASGDLRVIVGSNLTAELQLPRQTRGADGCLAMNS